MKNPWAMILFFENITLIARPLFVLNLLTMMEKLLGLLISLQKVFLESNYRIHPLFVFSKVITIAQWLNSHYKLIQFL